MSDGIYVYYPPNTTGSSSSSSSGSSSNVAYTVGPLDGASANTTGGTIGSFSLFLQSAGPIFPGLVSSASQTFSGLKTFTQPIAVQSGSSSFLGPIGVGTTTPSFLLDVVGSSATLSTVFKGSTSGAVTMQAPAAPSSYSLVLPVAQGGLGQTLVNNGVGSLSWSSSPGETPTTVVYDVVPANAQGATIGSNTLYMQAATSVLPGLVSSSSQTFSGLKTFSQPIVVQSGSSSFAGSLGVGTTSPSQQFCVGSGNQFTVSTIGNIVTSGNLTMPNGNGTKIFLNGVAQTDAITKSSGNYINLISAGPLSLYSNGTIQALTISTNSFVGIGTTTPTTPLVVNGPPGQTLTVQQSSTSAGQVVFSSQTNGSILQMYDGTSTLAARIDTRTGNSSYINNGGFFGIGTTAPATSLQVVGSVTTQYVDLTGGQIRFPVSQNASSDPNTLDDYEEGTWVPRLFFGGVGSGIHYSTQSGNYVKVGKMVTAQIYLTLSNKGASSGAASIASLPFTTGAFFQSFVCGYHQNLNAVTSLVGGYLTSGSTDMTLQYTVASSTTNMGDANFANNSQLMCTFNYIAST